MSVAVPPIPVNFVRIVPAPGLGPTGWGVILSSADPLCPIAQLELYTSQARATAPTILDAELLLQYVRTLLPDPSRAWLRDAFGTYSVETADGARRLVGLVGDIGHDGERPERLAVYARYRLAVPTAALNEPVQLLAELLPQVDATGARVVIT